MLTFKYLLFYFREIENVYRKSGMTINNPLQKNINNTTWWWYHTMRGGRAMSDRFAI